MLSNDKYNIVRIGDFATKANTKINYCLFSLGLCLEEYITNNSTDCFMLLGYSTLIWTFIEFFLHNFTAIWFSITICLTLGLFGVFLTRNVQLKKIIVNIWHHINTTNVASKKDVTEARNTAPQDSRLTLAKTNFRQT